MNWEKSRTLVAIVLCIGFFIAWTHFYEGPKAKKAAEAREAARIAAEAAASRETVEKPPVEADTRPVDSRPKVDLRPEPGSFEARTYVLKNDFVRLTFTDVGGAMTKAELLKYKRSALADDPLDLVKQFEGAARSFELRNLDDPKAWVHEQPWRVVQTNDPSEKGGVLEFVLETGVGTFDRPYRAVKRVTLRPDHPVADVEFSFEHFGGATAKEGALLPTQRWRFTPIAALAVDGADYGAEDLQGVRSVSFRRTTDGGDEFKSFAPPQLKKTEETNAEGEHVQRFALAGERRFTADLNTYFGVYCALVDMSAPVELSVVGVANPNATGDKARNPVRTRSDLQFELRPKKGDAPTKHRLAVYFGPNDQDVLRASMPSDLDAFAEDFTRVYSDALGMFKFIGRIVLWLLHALQGITGSWGAAIVLMTFCVRMLLFPINKRSQNAMRRHGEAMARIKPELEALKAKFKDKPQEFAARQMQLMKREKVPMLPLGGCLPIFLQIPVFYGLFSGLRAAVDLRQARFLWVSDLSLPDHLVRFATPMMNPMKLLDGFCPCAPEGMSDKITGLHLLPLLMTVAWVVNSLVMPKPANETPEQAQQRKMMLVMPFLFGLMMYGYAAALSLYWLTSSLVGIVESKVIKALNAKAAAKAA
jgi:YidC/Oxa1 family membrane protein insertase